jgi:alkylation response protein AidB-like acyl-CoA dehydrogenase
MSTLAPSNVSPSTLHTPERVRVIDKIAELGPRIAARAHDVDATATFPYENWADLGAAGLLGIVIPQDAGGLGADFVGYALASEELARHCPSTALTFNMHVATTLLVGEVADRLNLDVADRSFLDDRRKLLYQGVIDDGHIHSQPFSEGISASATSGYATRAVPVDGGYLVTGKKIFASLSGAANYHNVLCLVEGDERLRLLGVPHEGAGVEIQGEWNPLGMRGTDSRNLVMDNVFVPHEHEWLPPGVFNQEADRFPYFFMTLSFSYLGVMRAILDFTEDYLKTGGRRDHAIKQQGWTSMNIRFEQAQALCYRVLSDVCIDPNPAQIQRAQTSLVTTMEGAPEMASTAIQICGGRALLRPSAIERLYRDARCGAVMLPWSVEVCRERLGLARLYEEADDDIEAGA